jgi:RimJ/RimL family protein N-acetyltransferase
MFIRTKNLLLRPLWPEDAGALASALNDWEVAKYLAKVPYPYRTADADYFIQRCNEHAQLQPVFGIVLIAGAEHKLIGGAGLHGAELGYWIARAHWNKGYAFEAAQAVLELAFLGYGRAAVEASYMLDNPASAAVLRKLGFKDTGATEIWCEARQNMMPVRTMLLTRERWTLHQSRAVQALAA